MKLPIFISKKSQVTELLTFIVIIFMASLFDFVGWLEPIQTLATRTTIPLLSFQTRVVAMVYQPYEHLVFSFNKSKYLDELETKYAHSLTFLTELDALKKENAELKKILSVSDRKLADTTIVGAPILSLSSPAVGVGSSNGVSQNDMVLVNDVLVGLISEVADYQAKVSLLSAKNNKKVIARTGSGVEGIVEGDGKNVLLTHIPRNVVVTEGERIVTSGQDGVEKNVLIGVVQSVKDSPADATQTFIVSQLVSFYDAVLVEVR